MKKRHNRKNQQRRGPQLSDGERLWKRLSSAIGDRDELWSQSWNAQSIAELLIQAEKMRARFDKEPKAERIFRAKLDQSLATIRKEEQFFTADKTTKTVTMRSTPEIAAIKSSIASWEAFFLQYGKNGKLFQGPPNLENEHDRLRYEVIERAWLAILSGQEMPPELSLKCEGLTRWGSFDLRREICKFADARCGFRFQESSPSIALLLLQNQRFTVSELLDLRLAARKREGRNPFPRHYDEKLIAHSNLQTEVDGDKMVARGRDDLRHLPFVTIDPHDAKDFDDAVCMTTEGDNTTLWVAIADVAHYVQKNTRLDHAAKARATSVYLPHTVLPMLPPRLADDLCSLRADVDRLAMVIRMQLNADGEIIQSNAYEAVIRVIENLAYEDASGDNRFEEMFKLAAKWQAKEVKLNIANAEMRPRILADQTIKVMVKWPTDATKMIESFMVATNACVGTMLGSAGAPLPWRCHAPPDSAEVKELNAKLAALGVNIELPMPSFKTHGQSDAEELSDLLGAWANTTIESLPSADVTVDDEDDVAPYLANVLDPKARQDILDSLMDAQSKASSLANKTRRVVDQGLFHLMQRANYSHKNLGHFGLNLDAYAHFTSPIRRYPDLMVHRQLKAMLAGDDWAYDESETADIAEHCSNQSTIAKYIEWELVANAYHIHILRGGEVDSVSENLYPSVVEKSWSARIVSLRAPWVYLDLNDDGAIQGRMHLRQMDSKQRLNIDDNGLEVSSAEPGRDGEHRIVARLGEKYPCRLRGIDIWGGSLDLAPR